jgi:hypothetical protein
MRVPDGMGPESCTGVGVAEQRNVLGIDPPNGEPQVVRCKLDVKVLLTWVPLRIPERQNGQRLI